MFESCHRVIRACSKSDDTHAETTFRLLPKRTSPFKSAGESVQSTAGSRGVRIRVSNAGYTTCWGGVRVLATHSICQFPLHFPSRASPCAIRFQTSYTYLSVVILSYIMLTRYEGNVLLVFTSLPTTLLPANKASLFFFTICIFCTI